MNRHAKFIWIALILGFSYNYLYDKYPNATGMVVFVGVIIIAILVVLGVVRRIRGQA